MILFFRLFELISVSEKQFSGQLWENINRETKKKFSNKLIVALLLDHLLMKKIIIQYQY